MLTRELNFTQDGSSSTASLNSSILRYRRENGRSYHAYKDGGESAHFRSILWEQS